MIRIKRAPPSCNPALRSRWRRDGSPNAQSKPCPRPLVPGLAAAALAALLLQPTPARAQAIMMVLADRTAYARDGARDLVALVGAHPPRRRLILCVIQENVCELVQGEGGKALQFDDMPPQEREQAILDQVERINGWRLRRPGAAPDLDNLQRTFSNLNGFFDEYKRALGERRMTVDPGDDEVRVVVVANDLKLTPRHEDTVREVELEESCFGRQGASSFAFARPPTEARITLQLVVPGGTEAPARGFPPYAAALIARWLGNGQPGIPAFRIVQSPGACPKEESEVQRVEIGLAAACPSPLPKARTSVPPALTCSHLRQQAALPPSGPPGAPPSTGAPATGAGPQTGPLPLGSPSPGSPSPVPRVPPGPATMPQGSPGGAQTPPPAGPGIPSTAAQPAGAGPQPGRGPTSPPAWAPGAPPGAQAGLPSGNTPPAPGQPPVSPAAPGPGPAGSDPATDADLPLADGRVPPALVATIAIDPDAGPSAAPGISLHLSGGSGLKGLLMAFGPGYRGAPSADAPDAAAPTTAPNRLDLGSITARGRWRIFAALTARDRGCTGGLSMVGSLTIDLPGVKRRASFRARADACPVGEAEPLLLELADVTVP